MKGWKIMSNQNQVQVFEQQHMQVFKKLADITKQKKLIEEQEKKVKTDLEKAMDAYDIKSIDNQYIRITRVNGSTSTSIDWKTMQKEEPKLYAELLEDYPKVTTRKPSIRFQVK